MLKLLRLLFRPLDRRIDDLESRVLDVGAAIFRRRSGR
jgi:hypothetical protein